MLLCKRDVAKKKKDFKDTLHKLFVPLAMSTNRHNRSFERGNKNRKIILGQMLGQDQPFENTAGKSHSKQRDSESSTDIDRKRQRVRHEI